MRLRHLVIRSSLLIAIALGGCSTIDPAEEGNDTKATEVQFTGDPNQKRSIFVFLDGTANNPGSATNVWRLYQAVIDIRDPQTTAKYIEGVGSAGSPDFTSSIVFGLIWGQGMEARIKSAYDFVAKSYRPGDDLYVFGFSRGAHQARALAGLLSYVGVPAPSDRSMLFGQRQWNKILEITKKKSDADFTDYWKSWEPNRAPPLAFEAQTALRAEFLPVSIKLLGVWDTVPGSSFKKFGSCKELPDRKDGDRYKSDSYPTIRTIAHAVALDEKRDKFGPLLLCPQIDLHNGQHKNRILERWFPGAHADVGGGYDSEYELPNISLNWMLSILSQSYGFAAKIPRLPENPNGLSHWSVRDMPEILRIQCEDRKQPPQEALDPSVFQRKGSPPVLVKGTRKEVAYPISCKDEALLLTAP
jgi:uncharacterized protein (DUF2235 family)